MNTPLRPLIADRRRWSRAGLLDALLVILWLAPTASGCAANAPPTGRYLAYDPSAAREGTFFTLDEQILTDKVATAATEAFGGPGGYERARQEARGMNSDALARDYMAGADGFLSGVINIQFFKSLPLAPDAVNKTLESAENVIHMPDGSTVVVPIRRAMAVHAGSMRIAAEILREREPPVQLARAYAASVEGNCPFPAGGIKLTQRGFLVEGVRDGHPLLGGAVGRTRATFLALEKRYATITRATERTAGPGGSLRVDVPDRPSELYEAALGAPRVTLIGSTFKSCTIVLTPLAG